MAEKLTLTKEEKEIVEDSLMSYGNEIKKLMKKCSKMGRLKEESSLKVHYLEVESLRGKLSE